MLIEKTRLQDFERVVHDTKDNIMHSMMQLDVQISAFQIRMRIVATTILNTSESKIDAVLSHQHLVEADYALALDAQLLQQCQNAHPSTFMLMPT